MSLKNRRQSMTLGVWATQRLYFKRRCTSECPSVDAKLQTTQLNYTAELYSWTIQLNYTAELPLQRLVWAAEKSGFSSFRGLLQSVQIDWGNILPPVIGEGRTLPRRKLQGSAHPFSAAVNNVCSWAHIPVAYWRRAAPVKGSHIFTLT
jgi:hypothetical protein